MQFNLFVKIMKRIVLISLLCVLSIVVAPAKTFLVDSNLLPTVSDELLAEHNKDGGTYALYKGKYYRIGVTGFRSLKEFAENSATCGVVFGDTLYVAPGIYSESATIAVDGLTILGNNANHDWTTMATRNPLESEIQAVIYIEASNITVNGFKFTGAGRVISNKGTNETPIRNIKVMYNYFCNSTVKRGFSSALIELGDRKTDATANSDASQLRYLNCEVAHNYFYFPAGLASSAYPCGVAVCGAGGSTRIYDNYFNSTGTSVLLENAQGELYVTDNVFKNIGVNTITSATGGDSDKKGDFCIMIYRSAYANSTQAYIQNNEFDNCQGQETLCALIRIWAGSEDENGNEKADFVVPVNFKVNVNYNTFKGKTSVINSDVMDSKNGGTDQAGENIILYQDHNNLYDGTLYNIQDNHYDNRLYKFAWLRLEDGLSSQEIYVNNFTQFVLAGKYSTFGKESYKSQDITNHASNHAGTGLKHYPGSVIQSFDIDMETGDLYFLQKLKTADNNTLCSAYGLVADEEEGLILTRVPCTKKAIMHSSTNAGKFYEYGTTYQSMKLLRAGHGVKLSVVRDKNGQLWMLTGGKGTQRPLKDNGERGNSTSGTCVAKFKFVNGAQAILDGKGSSADLKVSDMSLSFIEHPQGLKNAYGTVDELSRYFCFSSSGGGVRKYCIYDLDDILEGKANPRFIKRVDIAKGDKPEDYSTHGGDDAVSVFTEKDNGFETWSYQSYAIAGDYLYLLEGVADDNSGSVVSGNPTIVISTYNWRTGKYLLRSRINYDRTNKSFGEPEGLVVRPDIYGHSTLYIGLADGASGAREASIYKYHINRYIEYKDYFNNGAATLTYTVYGDDVNETSTHFNTSQYPAITYSYAPSALEFSASQIDVSVEPQTVTITNTGEYRYGEWVGTISGVDGDRFSVDVSDNEQFQTGTVTATVKFIPDGKKRDYSASLRLHSPLASTSDESNDIVIPLTATYSGNIVRESAPNRPHINTYQVTETSSDGETLYSFNLAFDALLPSKYDNAYLAYTNGNAVDVMPFRQLIDHYVVEIDPTLNGALTEDQVTHLTIGVDKNADKKLYIDEVKEQSVENVFVIDGYTEGDMIYPLAVTTDDVFVQSMTIPNAIKVLQSDASDVRENATVNYTKYSQVYNKPLVFHNVDPNRNYPFKLFMSGSAKYKDAWEALHLDYYDGTHVGYENYVAGGYRSQAMVIPGSMYNHGEFEVNEVEVPDGLETPFNLDRLLSAMPLGVSKCVYNDEVTDPIHYTRANVLSSVGRFNRLCVTDEVLDYWNVDYNLSVALSDNDGNDYGTFALTYPISASGNGSTLVNIGEVNDFANGNVATISYLPIKVGDKMCVDDRDEYSKSVATYNTYSTDKYYSFKPTMNVNYMRIGTVTNSTETTTIVGVDNQQAIVDAQANTLATDITDLAGGVYPVNDLEAGAVYVYKERKYQKTADGEMKNFYFYDAITSVSWSAPGGFPVHSIGFHFDNEFALNDVWVNEEHGHAIWELCPFHNTIDARGGYIETSLPDGDENYTLLSGYTKYDGEYVNANNWSEISAEMMYLPVRVHHVYDHQSSTPLTLSEYSKIPSITATITSEYPFLFYKSADAVGSYNPIVGISPSVAGTTDAVFNEFNTKGSKASGLSMPAMLTVADAATTTINFTSNVVPTGISDVEVDISDINIYPNPAEDIVNVVASSVLGPVEIYSIEGQLMKVEKTEEASITMQVGELPSGTYILRASGKSTLLLKK